MLDRVRQRAWRSVRAAAPTQVSATRPSRSTASTARASSRSSSNCPSCRLINTAGQPRPLSLCGSQQRRLHISSPLGNRPGPSRFPARKATPLDDITRLRELINRANATNSKLSKERILAEFNDLVPLLAFLYDPYTRLHVTSSSVHNYLRQRQKDHDWQNNQAPLVSRPSNSSRDKTRAAALRAKQEEEVREQVPDTLLDLFQLLASRQITGHEALAVIGTFLHKHGIIAQHEYALRGTDDSDMSTTELFRQGLLRPTSLEIFYRCLDRNLKAGFGGRILHQAFATAPIHDEQSNVKIENHDGDRHPDAPVSFRGSFEVAVGRTITREELPSLLSNDAAPRWYASRKLDGVRCLFTVHFRRDQVGDDAQAKWKVASIEALSRNGRPFTSLAVLEKELAQRLTEYPGLHDLLVSSEEKPEHDTQQRQTATLILDGEVCILRHPEQASKSAIRQLDASLSAPIQDTTEGTMVEDFAAVVGLIKRKNYTIREPAFFPFDLLTLDEFATWRSSPANGRTRRTFSQRLASLESLVSYFEADAREKGKQSLVRRLSQNVVSATSQVEEMLATASQRGWEGLVLRQDTMYEGKRTSAIRKFKEWRDAEYTVKAITVATMRLPISGRFEEREAMASIQIEHKGTSVSVGSGFTPEQRVEFASDPDKIIGKVVTVEYFDESKTTAGASDGEESSQQADGGKASKEVYSLRFPRLKQIWGVERDL
ncbi:hypothetical protein PHSY_004645 [Pseudozyma hubeiensis SY62]|uniref:ATP-dependent DNA ligase family profile domain-containing protein n=1 Tax=Pseudozyma hubeiensis (strain SY62) TaxID=1305764 RepID=R9P6S3_PSEHS|nr:hypothetical protein PHSY_004645 [Pseudozyma hubeiensis SY62]GAC97061.1 hypothetical protein PHSY_004645 [Pseudozyma hubeiensis SY62]